MNVPALPNKGSCFTWHGRVDVFLNQTVAVQILSEKVNASADDSPVNTDLEDTEDLEPAGKKPRIDSEDLASGEFSVEIVVEVKSKKGKDTVWPPCVGSDCRRGSG